jgi:type I restriction enzyme R subunit
VAGSIYSACRFYEFFEQTELKGKCAIVTSYLPSTESIKKETTGEGETEKLHQYQVYRRMLAEHFNESEDTAVNKVQRFEQEIKKRFINEPGQLKLLIVVDKLLTGFDAPPATYLYIDKHMRDHGLFQAICRVNRLDGEDKEFGYIIDYKDLFQSLEKSMQDYTGGAFDGYDPEDVQGLLEDRLSKAKEKLEEIRESIKALCEPVEPPRDTRAYIHYFCGEDTTNTQSLKDNEPKRVELYKLVSSLLRAYAEVANEMHQAGYGPPEAREVKAEVEHFEKVRGEVKVASGDYVDMKAYEPAMRHLLDTYIRAEESQRLSAFDDMTLVDLIVRRGRDAIKELPEGIKNNQEAMAETIENNVRRLIVDEMPVNPKYYQKMSERLDALVRERRQQAMEYKKYLEKVVALTRDLVDRESRSGYPETINTPALQALYDNLGRDSILALNLDEAIRKVKKAEWRGNKFKEREVKRAIEGVLLTSVQESGGYDVDGIFELVKEQHEY